MWNYEGRKELAREITQMDAKNKVTYGGSVNRRYLFLLSVVPIGTTARAIC